MQRVASVIDRASPLERLYIRDRGAVVAVGVDSIIRLESDGDYTAVHTESRRFLLALPLKTVHERIQRADFVRVHRQHVVNLAQVTRLETHSGSRTSVVFGNGTSILASKSGSQLLRRVTRKSSMP